MVATCYVQEVLTGFIEWAYADGRTIATIKHKRQFGSCAEIRLSSSFAERQ